MPPEDPRHCRRLAPRRAASGRRTVDAIVLRCWQAATVPKPVWWWRSGWCSRFVVAQLASSPSRCVRRHHQDGGDRRRWPPRASRTAICTQPNGCARRTRGAGRASALMRVLLLGAVRGGPRTRHTCILRRGGEFTGRAGAGSRAAGRRGPHRRVGGVDGCGDGWSVPRWVRSWTPRIRTPPPSPPTPRRCAASWGFRIRAGASAWRPGDAILVKSAIDATNCRGRGYSRCS